MLPVAFPVIGNTRVRNTWNASRGGGTRPHHGVDLPAPIGTPVRATTPGVITNVWHEGPRGQPNQGNAIAVRDPEGWYHMFAHLRDAPSERLVGQRVEPGHIIGAVGNTGNARNTGPHLHYHITRALRQGAPRVDPTARLAMLHAAFESRRTEGAAARRSRPDYTPPQRESSAQRMQGVGDDEMSPIDARDLPAASSLEEREREASEPAEGRWRADRRPRMQTSLQAPPEAPAPPRERNTSREAIEQARLAYRAVQPMLEDEVESLSEQGLWDGVYAFVAPEEAETARRTKEALLPTVTMHLAIAAAAAREADAGLELRWLDAFDNLLAAQRIVLTLVDPVEAMREDLAVDPDNPRADDITPQMTAARTLLDLVSYTNAVFVEVESDAWALTAVAHEGVQDLVEATPDLASAGAWTGIGVVLGLGVAAGIAYAVAGSR